MPMPCRQWWSRSKNELMQTNINYQKDLNEVAVIVAQKFAGHQNEIGDGMAKVYASQFTEQELKDLVTFYKSPLGPETADGGAAGDSDEHGLYEPMGAGTSLRSGQWRVPRRDAQARQADLSERSDPVRRARSTLRGLAGKWLNSMSIFS